MKLLGLNRSRLNGLMVTTLTILLCSGCASHPRNLQIPEQVTCFQIEKPFVYVNKLRLSTITTQFQPGPYWSDRVDEDGIYYRAPIGGLKIKSNTWKNARTRDGGFYVPFNKEKPLRMFQVRAHQNVTPIETPQNLTCDTFAAEEIDLSDWNHSMARDVNVAAYATAGAVGAFNAAVIMHASGERIKVGNAMAGMAIGFIGAGFGAALTKDVIGAYVLDEPIRDPEALPQLRKLLASRQTLSAKQIANIKNADRKMDLAVSKKMCSKAKFQGTKRCKKYKAEKAAERKASR